MRRTKEDAEKTRADVLDAAENLFAEKGFQATSMDQIARRAGVTRGAIYWHFRDKGDLLSALRDRYRPPEVELMEAALSDGTADVFEIIHQVTAPCMAAFAAMESRQRMFMILEQLTPEDSIRPDNSGMDLMVRLMVRAEENGILAQDLTPQEAALSLVSLFRGLMTEWMVGGRTFDLPATGARLIARHIRSLRDTPQ